MTEILSFKEAVSYIKSLDVYGSVLGLSNMEALSKELSYPQDKLKFVHVTGTNGKGSVCTFLGSILKAAGYRVGSYNSPAVLSDIDQFRINLEIVKEGAYARAASTVKSACESIVNAGGIQPTRFEVETMAAFVLFVQEKCDIVVLETGLGGKDDATNIVTTKLLHVFTSISMDHAPVLGNTLAEIAQNKSHIVKSCAPTVMYVKNTGRDEACATGEAFCESTSEKCCRDEIINAYDVISTRCKEMKSPVYKASEDDISNIRCEDGVLTFDVKAISLYNIKLSMTGAYQPGNAYVAIMAARLLNELGYVITEDDIFKGLFTASIPFRFERRKIRAVDIICRHDGLDLDISGKNCREVDIILDGAHNPDGAEALMRSLKLVCKDRPIIYVTGIFKDKDYEQIAKISAKRADIIYVIENEESTRSLSKETLAETFRNYNKNVLTCADISTAKLYAVRDAHKYMDCGKEPIVLFFGSLSWLKRV